MSPRLVAPVALVASLAGCSPQAPPPLDGELEPVTLQVSDPIAFDPLPCASAVLVEAKTGTVVFAQEPDEPRAPASIAKMMLELIVMEMVDRAEFALTDPITASAWASKMGGSQVFLREGEVFPLLDLMKAVAIASANDACVAVAEHVAGSVEAFVDLMNRRAETMGLTATRYVNVHGLDDDPARLNLTTAREVAEIGRALVRHPDVLDWSSREREPFRNGAFILENTNTLIGRYQGIDGVKTGYTERAGYNLCASAEREGARFISVVMGADSRETCAQVTSRLLTRAFQEIAVIHATADGRAVGDVVAVGQSDGGEVQPLATRDVFVLASRFGGQVRVVAELRDPLLAPLVPGSPVGEAVVRNGGAELLRVPLVSDRAVDAKGFRSLVRGVVGK